MGLPAVAVSLASKQERHYDTAARVAVAIIRQLHNHPLKADQILSINVPDVPYEQLAGMAVTRLGKRHRAENMLTTEDPWGREIYWYGTLGGELDAGPGTDFYAINQGQVSVTPISVDMTAHDSLNSLARWIEAIDT